MKNQRTKILLLKFYLGLFTAVGLIVEALFFWNLWIRRRLLTSWASFISKRILKALNLKVKSCGTKEIRSGRMVVSNHLSYTDILILSSEAPCIFVTSVETKETSGIGLLSRLGGSIFVERRNPHSVRKEIKEISEAIHRGFRVVVFPEATTSDGAALLPFKKALFQAAHFAKAPVVTKCLNYTRVNGEPMHDAYRDRLFYYGDHHFDAHLPGLLELEEIEAELETIETLSAEGLTSRDLCEKAYLLILSRFRLVPRVEASNSISAD